MTQINKAKLSLLLQLLQTLEKTKLEINLNCQNQNHLCCKILKMIQILTPIPNLSKNNNLT